MPARDIFWLGLILALPVIAIISLNVWVARTASASDLRRMRAQFEGLLGEAGPGHTVVDIRRTGTTAGDFIYNRPNRLYEVTLRKTNGELASRRISVEASLFGDGSISETKARLTAS